MASLVIMDTPETVEAELELPVRLTFAEIDRLARIVERARRAEVASASRLHSVMQAGADAAHVNPKAERPSLAALARLTLSSRRRRDALFASMEFGEPLWDMMLDLYVAQAERRSVSVSSLCIAAAVPATTALRWIAVMTQEGHFLREPDRDDRRRIWIRLSPAMTAMLDTHLAECRHRMIAILT